MEIFVISGKPAVWRPAARHATPGTVQTAAPAAVASSSAQMKTLSRLLALLFLLLGLMGLARASMVTVTLDPNFPGDYHTYSYTVNGTTYTEYTSPYMATLTGGAYGTGVLAYVACFDINIDTYVGETYDGSLTLPGNNKVQDEVSYLMAQLSNLGGYNAPVSVSGPISMAIWQLELPSSLNPTPFVEDPNAQPWVTAAQNAVNSGAWTEADANLYPYWSPDAGVSAQRFGIEELYGPGSAPEPGSLALVGSALIGLSLLLRKHLKNN
jgi:hypothetical protein